MNTLLCCTDNSAPPDIWEAVKHYASLNAPDLPVVCVSHEPVGWGHNIVIGKQRRSWLCLYKQLRLGLRAIETENVVIVEHDCIYNSEHLHWQPPRKDTFYYNENCLFVQWSDTNHPQLKGMYSSWPKRRLALATLICNRDLYLETLEKRLDILDGERDASRLIDHIYEPGFSKINIERARKWAASGKPVFIKDYLNGMFELEKYKTFRTKNPNLDIRHGDNFTGPRRGRHRHWDNQYWGKFEDVINEKN